MAISPGLAPDADEASTYVANGPVRLHVLDNGVLHAGVLPPVLVVPGMGEHAVEYRWLLDRLGPRRVVVVDLRGRGASDAPATGYGWEDHVGDLRCVAETLSLDRPVVVAFSRGSSYALGYVLSAPGRVRGLVVGDYIAAHVRPPDGFPERHLRTEIRGTLVADRMTEHVVRRVYEEAVSVPMWERLGELTCPVLVIRGTRRSTLVTDDLAARWRAALPSVELVTMVGAGHDLWSRDPEAYLEVLRPFLDRAGG